MVLGYEPEFLTLVDALLATRRRLVKPERWSRESLDAADQRLKDATASILADIREHRLEWAASAAVRYGNQQVLKGTRQGEYEDGV